MLLLYFSLGLIAFAYLYFRDSTPKGEPPVVSLGWLPSAIDYGRDSKTFLAKARKKYGDVFTINLGLFKMTFVTSAQPGIVLLNSKETVFSFRQAIQTFVGHMTGGQVYDHPVWDDIYSKMALKDGLNSKQKQNEYIRYVETVVDRNLVAIEGKEVELFRTCSRIVLQSVIASLFGTEFAESHQDLPDKFFAFEMAGLHPSTLFAPSAPFGTAKACREIRDRLRAVIETEYHRRMKDQNFRDDNYFDYVLSIAKKMQEERPEDGQAEPSVFVTHLISIAFASHINTAGALGWAFARLAQNPEMIQTIREQQSDLAREFDENPNRRLNLEDMPKLKHQDFYLKECLRFYAKSTYAPRVAADDIQFENYLIPKGRFVTVQPLFVDDVFEKKDDFIPARWGTPAVENLGNTYSQWGWGTHTCMGRFFATNLFKTALFKAFKDYDIVMNSLPEPDYSKGMGIPFPSTAPAKFVRRH